MCPTKTEYDGQMNNKPTTVINKNVNGRKSVKSNHDISSAISIIVSSFWKFFYTNAQKDARIWSTKY